jgi:Ca-activated chloride channel family protein
VPELAALAAGNGSLGSPRLALLLGAAAAALWALSLWRGPLRLEVAAASGGARALADPVWLGCGALRALALGLLALAAGAPSAAVQRPGAAQSDLDLVIALDASPSMEALDGELGGRRASRLELAQEALSQFIAARPTDRIGLVVFGEHAFSAAPPSLDHAQLRAALRRVRAGVVGDATALGEALALATRRLRLAQPQPGAAGERRRAIVLITDGRHNAGALAPETAAAIAAREGVRVHAIGLGGEGPVPFAGGGPEQPLRMERADLDARTLRALAERSGGRFLQIARPQQLVQATARIAELVSRPLPGPAERVESALATPLLGLALLLLAAESALGSLLLRRLP